MTCKTLQPSTPPPPPRDVSGLITVNNATKKKDPHKTKDIFTLQALMLTSRFLVRFGLYALVIQNCVFNCSIFV